MNLKKLSEEKRQEYINMGKDVMDKLPENERLIAAYVKCEAERNRLIDAEYESFKIKDNRVYDFFKRAFDIAASFFGIILLSWLFIIAALMVKICDHGPILYKSVRIKKDGHPFIFYKFRSMYVNADADKYGLKGENEVKDGPTFKIGKDPRITKVGHILRKTSIDELPQLFNILKGDMSVVGPRPCTHQEFLKYYKYPEAKFRLKVPQGLTGQWQANGRSTTDFNGMLNLDLEYVTKKRSFWYDIFLILKTVIVVITGKGAE